MILNWDFSLSSTYHSGCFQDGAGTLSGIHPDILISNFCYILFLLAKNLLQGVWEHASFANKGRRVTERQLLQVLSVHFPYTATANIWTSSARNSLQAIRKAWFREDIKENSPPHHARTTLAVTLTPPELRRRFLHSYTCHTHTVRQISAGRGEDTKKKIMSMCHCFSSTETILNYELH